MLVIKKVNEERYRTKPGAKKIYTIRLSEAWTFDTAEEADGARIPGNEVVADVSHHLG